MKLSGLHILLTYQCTFECDHCFVWGSPWQTGTLTLDQIKDILNQAKETGVDWIYFEGGEPFLYYGILVRGVEIAHEMGFHVGIVSNGYWAHTEADALEWLKPLAGKLDDMSISCDFFHYSEQTLHQAMDAVHAAEKLGIPVGTISIAKPEESAPESHGMIEDAAQVMYRGRAVKTLASKVEKKSWAQFTQCPHEDLREPGRVHLDPLGNLHICQGIVIGNLFEQSLKQICADYDPELHPVCGPLIASGPVGIVKEYDLAHNDQYADACHLCYDARLRLRSRFPDHLKPDQMYGTG